MRVRACLANLAWFALNRRGHRRFLTALGDPRRAQESILEHYLRQNEDTAFGRRFGFSSIRSVQDYRERVPLLDYDDYLPFVERIAAGEKGVLTREAVKLFEPSSGSTRAAKWIPYTASLQAEFRSGVAPWIFDLFARKPALLGGPAYWSITPVSGGSPGTPGLIPIGFEEDSAYLGGRIKRLVDLVVAVPAAVRRIQDIDLYRRVSLLFLLRARDLRLISIWHPTFLSLLLAPLQSHWHELVTDIDRGFRLSQPSIEIPPAPARARELSLLNPAQPAGIWPRLRLISCWGDGHAAIHVAEIQGFFPGVEIQTKGLIATEAFVSLPFRDRKPLAVASHFFEFLDADGSAHTAWEVETNGVYSLVVTTGGGLYRYRLQDRVEVTGFLGRTPCLGFLGKEDHVSDLFGEKLSEGFAADAIERVLIRRGIQPRFALLAPETAGGRTRYVLFIEAAEAPPTEWCADLEAVLQENPNYALCVRLGQLAPARICPIGAGAYGRYVAHLTPRGQRLGNIKPSPLSALQGWSAVFKRPDAPPAAGDPWPGGAAPASERV